MKEDPTSHATDVALQSVVDLLHGAEVLGDASLGLGSDNDSSAPDNSEEAAKKRAAELRREEVVKAMAQLCREQDEFNQEHGSSILRWKVCSAPRPKASRRLRLAELAEPSELVGTRWGAGAVGSSGAVQYTRPDTAVKHSVIPTPFFLHFLWFVAGHTVTSPESRHTRDASHSRVLLRTDAGGSSVAL